MFGYDTLFKNLPMMRLVFEEDQMENDMIPSFYRNARHAEELVTSNQNLTINASFRLVGTFYAYSHPTSVFARENLLYIQSSGLLDAAASYYTRRSALNSYLLKFTVSGCGKLIYEDKEYLLPEGTGFLIDCRKNHLYRTEGDRWQQVELHMRGVYLDHLYTLFHKDGGVIFRPEDTHQFLTLLDEIIRVDCSIDPLRELRVSALLNKLWIELLSDSENYRAEMDRLPQQLQPLVRFLEKNYMETFSLDELSEYCGLSKHHMCRVFRKYVGFSIVEYQNDLRIQRARELLQTTNFSAAEVGYLVGISDVNYFYRLFKKKVGIAPGRYAKSKRGASDNAS